MIYLIADLKAQRRIDTKNSSLHHAKYGKTNYKKSIGKEKKV